MPTRKVQGFNISTAVQTLQYAFKYRVEYLNSLTTFGMWPWNLFYSFRGPNCRKSSISSGLDATGGKKINKSPWELYSSRQPWRHELHAVHFNNLSGPSRHVLGIDFRPIWMNLKRNLLSNLLSSSRGLWIQLWDCTDPYCVKNGLRLQQAFPVQVRKWVTTRQLSGLCVSLCVTPFNHFSLSTQTNQLLLITNPIKAVSALVWALPLFLES